MPAFADESRCAPAQSQPALQWDGHRPRSPGRRIRSRTRAIAATLPGDGPLAQHARLDAREVDHRRGEPGSSPASTSRRRALRISAGTSSRRRVGSARQVRARRGDRADALEHRAARPAAPGTRTPIAVGSRPRRASGSAGRDSAGRACTAPGRSARREHSPRVREAPAPRRGAPRGRDASSAVGCRPARPSRGRAAATALRGRRRAEPVDGVGRQNHGLACASSAVDRVLDSAQRPSTTRSRPARSVS